MTFRRLMVVVVILRVRRRNGFIVMLRLLFLMRESMRLSGRLLFSTRRVGRVRVLVVRVAWWLRNLCLLLVPVKRLLLGRGTSFSRRLIPRWCRRRTAMILLRVLSRTCLLCRWSGRLLWVRVLGRKRIRNRQSCRLRLLVWLLASFVSRWRSLNTRCRIVTRARSARSPLVTRILFVVLLVYFSIPRVLRMFLLLRLLTRMAMCSLLRIVIMVLRVTRRRLRFRLSLCRTVVKSRLCCLRQRRSGLCC